MEHVEFGITHGSSIVFGTKTKPPCPAKITHVDHFQVSGLHVTPTLTGVRALTGGCYKLSSRRNNDTRARLAYRLAVCRATVTLRHVNPSRLITLDSQLIKVKSDTAITTNNSLKSAQIAAFGIESLRRTAAHLPVTHAGATEGENKTTTKNLMDASAVTAKQLIIRDHVATLVQFIWLPLQPHTLGHTPQKKKKKNSSSFKMCQQTIRQERKKNSAQTV